MIDRKVALLSVAMSFHAFGQQKQSYAYSPALYTPSPTARQEIEAFPIDSNVFHIPLPFPLGTIAYSTDGRALYADHQFDPRTWFQPGPPIRGLFEIRLDGRVSVNRVPASEQISEIFSLAVSAHQDKIVFVGGVPGGKRGVAALLELLVRDGEIRTIMGNFGSGRDSSLYATHLSLSPDGVRAVATRNHRLEMIDLVSGTTAPVGDFESGEFSPDGKWLATRRGEMTSLLDAKTLKEERSLGATLLKWSPDSRYLLSEERKLSCGLTEARTLEIVAIETGKRTEVESSRCLIDRDTLGWVSSDLASHH